MGSDVSRLIKNSVLTPLVSGFPLPRFQIDCSQTRVTWPVTNRRTSLHRSHCIHDIHWIWLRWRLTEPVVGGHHFHWVIFFSGGQSRSSESVTDSVTRVSPVHRRPQSVLLSHWQLSRVLTSVRHLDHDGIWDGIYAGSGLVAVVPHLRILSKSKRPAVQLKRQSSFPWRLAKAWTLVCWRNKHSTKSLKTNQTHIHLQLL